MATLAIIVFLCIPFGIGFLLFGLPAIAIVAVDLLLQWLFGVSFLY